MSNSQQKPVVARIIDVGSRKSQVSKRTTGIQAMESNVMIYLMMK